MKIDHKESFKDFGDQFNPSFYKYFSKIELTETLEKNGFKVESLVNTVGHQYTVVCSKNL